MTDEIKEIRDSLADMHTLCSTYYEKVREDLVYESGYRVDDKSDSKMENDKQTDKVILYARKYVNGIVNPLMKSMYSIDVDHDDETIAQIANDVLDESIDCSHGREAIITAIRKQVVTGIGYVLIGTDYSSDDSLDQEIRLIRVDDPTTVFLSEHTEIDGSDADYGALLDWMDEKKAIKLYGDDVKIEDWASSMYHAYTPKNLQVPVLTYYSKEETSEKKVFSSVGITDYDDGAEITNDQTLRTLTKTQVKMSKWVGAVKIHETVLDIPWIPIVAFKGDETITPSDGTEYRGIVYLTRFFSDLANFYKNTESSIARTMPLPQLWVPAEGMPEGSAQSKAFKNIGKELNVKMAYKSIDENGNPLPKPEIMQSTMPTVEYQNGAEGAVNSMQLVSGIPDIQFGDDPAEQSGRSVYLRQKSARIASLHYQINSERSIRHICDIILAISSLVDTKDRNGIVFSDLDIRYKDFDVTLSQGPSYELDKYEDFAMVMDLASNTALHPMLPFFLRDSKIPNAEKIAKVYEQNLGINTEDEEIPAEAKEIIETLQSQVTQATQITDELQSKVGSYAQYITQLQNELQSNREDIASKERMQESKQRHEFMMKQMELQAKDKSNTDNNMVKLSIEDKKMELEALELISEETTAVAPMTQPVSDAVSDVVIDAVSADIIEPRLNSVVKGGVLLG